MSTFMAIGILVHRDFGIAPYPSFLPRSILLIDGKSIQIPSPTISKIPSKFVNYFWPILRNIVHYSGGRIYKI